MIGNPQDLGAFFSWGNVEPHFANGSGGFDDGYNWGTSNDGVYASTPGASIEFVEDTGNADYEPDGAYDAAHVLLGDGARVPTENEFEELLQNTDYIWTTLNGINGVKFMKRTDHSVFVFFPAAGYGSGTSHATVGSFGRYWSSSLASATWGHELKMDRNTTPVTSGIGRYYGFSIRPVRSGIV